MKRNLDYSFERCAIKRGYLCVAGVDEVGRGPLAGPVCAGAVVLKVGAHLPNVYDSKKLNEREREKLFRVIRKKAVSCAIGWASVSEIDSLNIREASFLAMRRALNSLDACPDFVYSDGFVIPNLRVECEGVIRGDMKIKSVAAASIIAKVIRDNYMKRLHGLYPVYGFDKHKGYGTKSHYNAILEHGASLHHRKSFLKSLNIVLS